MRKSLTITSAHGGALNLLNDAYFTLVDFQAETEMAASISATTLAGYDGDLVSNIQAQARTVIIELYIKEGVKVEEAKRHILQVIKAKQVCTFRAVSGERDMTLSGYVEAIQMPRYQNEISMFVTFHCSQPFWEDAVDIIQTLTGVDPLHYFTDDPADMLYFPEDGIPFGAFNLARQQTYYNHGDVEVGMEIRITALGRVTNPIIYASDGSYIGVNTTMDAHDVVSITTQKGRKTITKNGVNILSSIMSGSTWLQLHTGQNTFNANSEDAALDNMYFELIYKQRYV